MLHAVNDMPGTALIYNSVEPDSSPETIQMLADELKFVSKQELVKLLDKHNAPAPPPKVHVAVNMLDGGASTSQFSSSTPNRSSFFNTIPAEISLSKSLISPERNLAEILSSERQKLDDEYNEKFQRIEDRTKEVELKFKEARTEDSRLKEWKNKLEEERKQLG
uniref:Uncharacterized protein n=1 Tax=Panagrolaimus superbus TaxID=310955 RepID=A0A914YPB3_9BILA